MKRPSKAAPQPGLVLDAGPPDPDFKARLLKVFEGHPMEEAVQSGRFALGVIPRDRPAAWARLEEMEADPDRARAQFARAKDYVR